MKTEQVGAVYFKLVFIALIAPVASWHQDHRQAIAGVVCCLTLPRSAWKIVSAPRTPIIMLGWDPNSCQMYRVRVGKIKNIFYSLKVGLDRKLGSLQLGDNKHVYQSSHNEMNQSKIISFCHFNSVVRRPHVCYKLCHDVTQVCVTPSWHVSVQCSITAKIKMGADSLHS